MSDQRQKSTSDRCSRCSVCSQPSNDQVCRSCLRDFSMSYADDIVFEFVPSVPYVGEDE